MKIAYQGEQGAYSEEAAHGLFPDTPLQPTPTIRKVFEAVETGGADAGLVPIENSQGGSINETYDLFLKHGLHLVAETIISVNHCLLALPLTALDDLDEVVSHPQAIAQCEEFLSALGVTVRSDYDTAGVAKRIAENKLERMAAIASRRAADLYGLTVLAENIQTYPDNFTRFGVISKHSDPLGNPNKTSIVFGAGHVAGSLFRCLGAFAERHLSLSKLESRPRPGRPWEYVFYADVDSAATAPEMVDALTDLTAHTTFTRVLGTYASALP